MIVFGCSPQKRRMWYCPDRRTLWNMTVLGEGAAFKSANPAERRILLKSHLTEVLSPHLEKFGLSWMYRMRESIAFGAE
jgi:hypothetical protein